MEHKFQSSLTDATACQVCHKDILTHTNMAVCECCPNIGPVEIFGDMAMCAECIAKEMKIAADYQAPELQESRLAEYKIRQSQIIDAAITVRTDIFNSETVAIAELKQAIDSDDTIKNKHYRLAEVLTERYNHYKTVIFE